jgi:hypothetical protein
MVKMAMRSSGGGRAISLPEAIVKNATVVRPLELRGELRQRVAKIDDLIQA